jgi:hypothetical protein
MKDGTASAAPLCGEIPFLGLATRVPHKVDVRRVKSVSLYEDSRTTKLPARQTFQVVKWSVDMAYMTDSGHTIEEAKQAEVDRLSCEEDDELRRLYFMSQHGELSERSRQRMLELRLRDRREKIRPPREL